MTVTRGKLVVAAVLAFLGLSLGAGYSLAGVYKLLTIRGDCPEITSETPFNISLRIKNDHDNVSIRFERVTIAYINPDGTFSGPVEGTITPVTLGPGIATNRTVSFTVTTSQPTGSVIPLMVSLFENRLCTDPSSFRGTVMVGAKVAAPL